MTFERGMNDPASGCRPAAAEGTASPSGGDLKDRLNKDGEFGLAARHWTARVHDLGHSNAAAEYRFDPRCESDRNPESGRFQPVVSEYAVKLATRDIRF